MNLENVWNANNRTLNPTIESYELGSLGHTIVGNRFLQVQLGPTVTCLELQKRDFQAPLNKLYSKIQFVTKHGIAKINKLASFEEYLVVSPTTMFILLI